MIAKGKRLLAFAVVLCLLLCLLPGCGGENEPNREAYVLPESFETIDSQVLGENANYSLKWDDEYKSVMMYSKTGEKVWGTTPDEFYKAGETNNFVSSPLIIEVVNVSSLGVSKGRAYDGCIEAGTLSAKKIENGVEVTYYFDEFQVSVPVQFSLRENSMAVSVDTTRITEGDVFQLVSVSLAPYACAVEIPLTEKPDAEDEEEDDEDEDEDDIDIDLDFDFDFEEDADEDVAPASVAADAAEKPLEDNTAVDAAAVNLLDDYLFIPVGSGALVSPTLKDYRREYKAEVYGTDASRYQPYEYYKEENIKMPVFGVKAGSDALVGIMEQGAELASIEMSAGNERMRYSNIAATFNLRGKDIYADKKSYTATMTTRYSKAMVDATLMVGFYPLAGDDADYIGMANTYREYLLDNGLTKKTVAQNPYALSILGNVVTTSLAFGVPYDSTKSMTTFAEAADMIKDLAAATKLNPSVQLVGYGSSGMDIGEVAGGYKFAGVSGSKKEYAALTDYATKNNIPLFTDFDLIYFNKSGNGFSASSDVAKTATLHKSEVYHRMLALRAQDEDRGAFRLLNRANLIEAMEKLLKKDDKLGVTGYSFSTLGTTAYSDYTQPEHQVKHNMGADVTSMLTSVLKAGHTVATDNANDYAAIMSDTIFNVEVDPRYTDAFDAYVPFYQIVFKGYVPMYSEALNLSSNYEASVLQALASGVGLGYTLLENYDVSYAASVQTNLYSSLYSAKKAQIVETVAKYSDYYKAINGATITDYAVQDNGVTVTTFSNGVVAYTNSTAVKQTYPNGELAAMGFAYVQGGTNG